jgi:hypothetical protein
LKILTTWKKDKKMNLCLIFVNIFEEFEMGYEEIQKGVLFL